MGTLSRVHLPVALFLVFLGACAAGDGLDADERSLAARVPRLRSIQVVPATPSVPVGLTVELRAIGTFSDGTTRDITAAVSWSSSAPAVASVQAGQVTGLAPGAATITAAASTRRRVVSGSTVVTVTPPVFVRLDVTPADPSIAVGRTVQLAATGTRSDGSTADLTDSVTWGTHNDVVARVSASGLVTGLAPGSADISASYLGLEDRVAVTVTAPELDAVSVFPASWFLPIGIVLAATAHYSDGTTADVTGVATWTSSAPAIAPVAANGHITGLALGTTEVTAMYAGLSDSIAVTVIPAAFTSITIAPEGPSVRIGGVQAFTATGGKSDGTSEDLTDAVAWSSSDPEVATIGAAGVAGALAVGTTTIRAAYLGLEDETTLTVLPHGVVGIEVGPVSLQTGGVSPLVAIGTFSDGVVRDVTAEVAWASSATAVVQVAGGRAFGIGPGAAAALATLDGVTGQGAVTVSGTALASVTVAPKSTNPVSEGNEEWFFLTGHFADGTVRDLTGPALWSSSAPAVAAIRNGAGAGRAVAVSPGAVPRGTPVPVVIGAAFGQMTDTAIMTVRTRLITFGVRPANPVVTTGTTLRLRSFGRYSDGADVELTAQTAWTGSAQLAIDGSGLATGVAAAATSLSATVFDPIEGVTRLASQAATVTGAALVSIAVSGQHAQVPEGGVELHTALGTYSDQVVRDISTQVAWSSTDESAATVSNLAFSEGLATVFGPSTSPGIVASHAGVSGSTPLVVKAATLESIRIFTAGPPPLALAVGARVQLIAEGEYSDGSRWQLSPAVTWSTSDGQRAVVSNRWFDSGRLFGLAPGSVTVFVTMVGVVGSIPGTVTF